MNSPQNGVNICNLRIKLFGPTLDDSVLYGVDRMIDCVRSPTAKKRTAEDNSFYKSCESLPVFENRSIPKLSPDELNFIYNAIAQAHRRRHGRPDEKSSKPRKNESQPQLRQTRWAFTRINEFDDGAKTYEIMTPMEGKSRPTQLLDEDTEIVFAVLEDGNTLTYLCQDQRNSGQ